MKIPDSIYRRLVVLNSIGLLFVIVSLLFIALFKRDYLSRQFDRIVASAISKFDRIEAFGIRTSKSRFQNIDLVISPTYLNEIQTLINTISVDGVLQNDKKRWYPATLISEGESFKGKIRLRGDLPVHWKNAKKSWRFKFRKKRLFQGYRVVDFIIPSDKANEIEVVANQLARKHGLLVPDAQFVTTRLNGADMGLYLFQEKLTTESFARKQTTAGSILQDRNVWTQTWKKNIGLPSYVELYYQNKKRPGLELFSGSYKLGLRGPNATTAVKRWNALLALIRNAPDDEFYQAIPDYLNIEKYIKWNALTWLFGSLHSHWGDNLRWFYDPTQKKFEPILYDVNRYPISRERGGTFEAKEYDPLAKRLLKHPKYQDKRNAYLWTLLKDEENLPRKRARMQFRNIERLLSKGVNAQDPTTVRTTHFEGLKILKENEQYLKECLSFSRALVTPRLTPNTLVLSLIPDSLSPMELTGIRLPLTRYLGPTEESHLTLTSYSGKKTKHKLRSSMTDLSIRLTPKDIKFHLRRDEQLHPQVSEWQIELPLARPLWEALDRRRPIQLAFENSLTRTPVPQSHILISPLTHPNKDAMDSQRSLELP